MLWSTRIFWFVAWHWGQTSLARPGHLGTRRSCPSYIAPPKSAGSVQLGGINIAGCDFGCPIDGSCHAANAWPPVKKVTGVDGVGQMQHFAKEGFNMFRLPTGWQYLTNDTIGGILNPTYFKIYDTLVQGCLATGAHCIIDIHNYARWNGAVIGQGGPTDTQFAALWTSLATYYKKKSKVIFGIMNEPHDLNLTLWTNTLQKVVDAIRNAGASSQIILLPGIDWVEASTFISSGSADALSAITNPDKSTTNLVFDIHKYLDSNNMGNSYDCITDNIDEAFYPVAQWLRCKRRKALLTETGGGNSPSCVSFMTSQLQFINKNSDVYLGFSGWGAGGFQTDYVLSETPFPNGTDQVLVKQALLPNIHP